MGEKLGKKLVKNKSDFRGLTATSMYDFGESNPGKVTPPPAKTMHFNILDNNI